MTAGDNERDSSVVVVELLSVAQHDLLPPSEVLGEVEVESVLLPVVEGSNVSEAGGEIVKAVGKSCKEY